MKPDGQYRSSNYQSTKPVCLSDWLVTFGITCNLLFSLSRRYKMLLIDPVFEVGSNTKRHTSAEIDGAACDILLLTRRLDWVCFYCKILPSFLRGSVIWCLGIQTVSFNFVRIPASTFFGIYSRYTYIYPSSYTDVIVYLAVIFTTTCWDLCESCTISL